MPTSREGFEYTRHLFKEIVPSMTGGCHADVWYPQRDEIKDCKVPVGECCRPSSPLVFLPHHNSRSLALKYLAQLVLSAWLTSGITYHGGGFVTADSQHVFTGHIEYLLKRGFAIVSLEYRMCPQ